MSESASEARISALESELAFQGDTVAELHEALANQQQDLLTLQRQVTLLGEQLRNLRDSGFPAAPAEGGEKPPHY